jgi:hypothetical protein
MRTAANRDLHDSTCPPSCPHFGGLFAVGSTEAWELRTYSVLMLEDRYDEDSFRTWVTVRASGPNDARNQARLIYPKGAPLRTELAP